VPNCSAVRVALLLPLPLQMTTMKLISSGLMTCVALQSFDDLVELA
jgi:hypothetical protein